MCRCAPVTTSQTFTVQNVLSSTVKFKPRCTFQVYFAPPPEVLYKWSFLQTGRSGVSDDRGRGSGQPGLDEGGRLADLRPEAGSALLDAGASLLRREPPDRVSFTFRFFPSENINVNCCWTGAKAFWNLRRRYCSRCRSHGAIHRHALNAPSKKKYITRRTINKSSVVHLGVFVQTNPHKRS